MKVFTDKNNDVMLKFENYLFIGNCKNSIIIYENNNNNTMYSMK